MGEPVERAAQTPTAEGPEAGAQILVRLRRGVHAQLVCDGADRRGAEAELVRCRRDGRFIQIEIAQAFAPKRQLLGAR